MRARYVIVIIAIAILAVGAKLLLYPLKSEAISSDAGLDIQQMHKDRKKIPVEVPRGERAAIMPSVGEPAFHCMLL